MSSAKYMVSSTPHLRSPETIDRIMKDVVVALAPAALMGVYLFGMRALMVIIMSVASSVFFEAAYQKLTKQEVMISDFSAVVTGLLLAMNLPASSPWWMPVVGSFFAIVIVKQLFGGLGQNFINPALCARAFLIASYPTQMTAWTAPVLNPLAVDAVSSATPLGILKEMGTLPTSSDYINALIGNISGCIGETCSIALILGGLYLLYKRIISWRIPATYLLTVFIMTFIFGRTGFFSGIPFYELITGGLLLGAFFMATDYSTSPVTPKGQLIMGIGCGILTSVIRIYSGGYPEGVSYSILIMNMAVPLIDRFTRPAVYGFGKRGRERGGVK